MYIHVYIYLFVHTIVTICKYSYFCIYTCTCTYICIHVYIHIYSHIRICIHINMHKYIFIYIPIYLYIYTHICVNPQIHICIYIYTQSYFTYTLFRARLNMFWRPYHFTFMFMTWPFYIPDVIIFEDCVAKHLHMGHIHIPHMNMCIYFHMWDIAHLYVRLTAHLYVDI